MNRPKKRYLLDENSREKCRDIILMSIEQEHPESFAKHGWSKTTDTRKATLDEVRKEFIGNGWTGCESAKAMQILDKLESEGTNE